MPCEYLSQSKVVLLRCLVHLCPVKLLLSTGTPSCLSHSNIYCTIYRLKFGRLLLAAQLFVGHRVPTHPGCCCFGCNFLWTGENHVFVLTFKTVYRIQSVPYVPLLWLVSDMGNTEARTLINLWLFAWQDAEGCGLLDSEKTPAWEQTGPLREYILCKAINNCSGSPSFQC